MPPHIVFGAGGIGTTAKSFTFTWDTPDKVNELLAALDKLGIRELDSAASYPPGNPFNTETLLGESKAADMGFIIDSKISILRDGGSLGMKNIAESSKKTFELLKMDKIRTMYAHAPDPTTPLAEQAENFHRQFQEGKFEQLGLCNYSVEQMSEYFDICDKNGFQKPTIYQGLYNALYRGPEKDFIPLLRKHNCAFYAFSPLAGGFLTGKVTFASEKDLDRTRWRGESTMSIYPALFETPSMHSAIRNLQAACEAAEPKLSLQEASLRWIKHHSALRDGDAFIIGAKRIDQLEGNVADIRRGPLPESIRQAVEDMWTLVDDGTFGKDVV